MENLINRRSQIISSTEADGEQVIYLYSENIKSMINYKVDKFIMKNLDHFFLNILKINLKRGGS